MRKKWWSGWKRIAGMKYVCCYVLLMNNSWQEGVSAEFRNHTFPPVLPKKAGSGSTQTSVTRWVLSHVLSHKHITHNITDSEVVERRCENVFSCWISGSLLIFSVLQAPIQFLPVSSTVNLSLIALLAGRCVCSNTVSVSCYFSFSQ